MRCIGGLVRKGCARLEVVSTEHITMTITVAERTMVTIEMWMFMVAEAFVEYLSHPKISILGCEYLFK